MNTEAEQILGMMSRKRVSAVNDDKTVWSAKRPRADIEPMCKAINNIALERSLPEDAPDSDAGMNSHDRGRRSSRRTSKTRIESGAANTSSAHGAIKSSNEVVVGKETLEEQLISGRIHKDEVSQILFRLPDGSRLQKTFLSTDLVRVSWCVL